MAATALLAFPFGRYLPGLGQDFFPSVDAGQIKLHIRAPTGMRIEETAALCDRVEAAIRDVIPASEIATIVDNIGVPYSGINLTYSTSAPGRPRRRRHLREPDAPSITRPSDYVRRAARAAAAALYPSTTFAFLPADIVSQILNFGLPAPDRRADVGLRREAPHARTPTSCWRACARSRASVDLRIQQAFDYPTLNVDRRPQQGGAARAHRDGRAPTIC